MWIGSTLIQQHAVANAAQFPGSFGRKEIGGDADVEVFADILADTKGGRADAVACAETASIERAFVIPANITAEGVDGTNRVLARINRTPGKEGWQEAVSFFDLYTHTITMSFCYHDVHTNCSCVFMDSLC